MTRVRSYYLPRILLGIILGFILGALSVVNLYVTAAVVLVGLCLLGRFESRATPPKPGGMTSTQAEEARIAVWVAGCDATPAGSAINVDRPFVAYADCERGHQDFHLIGATFHDGRTKWINRSCALDGCDSAWREKA